jgi:DNA-binding transcriptional MocR family regulator
MPYNSFENYVMAWAPDRKSLKTPIYLGLAKALEYDILNGNLASGTKLPPQRELADYLEVSLSTITRAYTICEKKGLIHAITGRGTFVSETANVVKSVIGAKEKAGFIDLDIAAPFCTQMDVITQVIRDVSDNPEILNFFKYTNPLGTEKQIASAIKWLKLFGVHSNGDDVLIANGTQNALNLVLSALFKYGDKIAVDQYTYANFIGLANILNIALVPIVSDEDGMNPEELRKAVHTNSINGIYISPSCSNPQAICMPLERRKEIADIINENEIILIEDECYPFLLEKTIMPISVFVPDFSIYLNGMNKAICPGLRIAFIWHCGQFRRQLEVAIYSCNLIVSPLNAEIAAEIIQRNIHLDIIKDYTAQTVERNKIYSNYFQTVNMRSYYQWLPLPSGITGTLFESLASNESISVYGSERFLVGDSLGKYYLRISVSAPKTAEDLDRALSRIKNMIIELGENALVDYTI